MGVEIRSPFPEYALPRVWLWLAKVRNRVADDFGPKTVDEWVDQECGGKTSKTWGVYRDGELGGMISFQRMTPWLGTAHCTFRPDFWGRATTRPAIERAFEEIFNSGIGKLTFLVFSDNQAVRSLLCDMGALSEGTHKGQTVRDGKPADMKSFGLSKERFDAAVANSRAGGGSVGAGKCVVGEIQDANKPEHQHVNADNDAGNAGAHEATDGVCGPIYKQPDAGIAANQERGDGQH